MKDSEALVVVCEIAQQRYALPLDMVIEVVHLPALVALAGAPPTICGLLNLHGRHLPVLDGRALLGAAIDHDLHNQIMIVGRDQPGLGLLVDQVCDVYAVPAGRMLPIKRGDAAPYLVSVFESANTAVLVFDPAVLLARVTRKRRSKARP